MHSLPQFLLIPFDARAESSLVALGRLVLGHGADWERWAPFLEDGSSGVLRIDLGGVTDIDAAGLGLLARLAQHARHRGRPLWIVSAAPRVRQLITLTGLETQVPSGVAVLRTTRATDRVRESEFPARSRP